MITQRHNRSFICTHTLTQTQTYTLFGLPFGSKTFESLIAGTTPQCSLLQLTPWGESNSLIRPKIRPLLQVLALEIYSACLPPWPQITWGTSLESRVLLDLHYIGHIHLVLQRLGCWAASLKGPFFKSMTCRLSVALRAALGRQVTDLKKKKNGGRWSLKLHKRPRKGNGVRKPAG